MSKALHTIIIQTTEFTLDKSIFFPLSCDKVTLIGNHLGYQFMHATFKIG
jgi:hypothetical protein